MLQTFLFFFSVGNWLMVPFFTKNWRSSLIKKTTKYITLKKSQAWNAFTKFVHRFRKTPWSILKLSKVSQAFLKGSSTLEKVHALFMKRCYLLNWNEMPDTFVASKILILQINSFSPSYVQRRRKETPRHPFSYIKPIPRDHFVNDTSHKVSLWEIFTAQRKEKVFVTYPLAPVKDPNSKKLG